MLLGASGADAQSFADRTAIIDVHAGTSLDSTIFALGTGGYAKQNGAMFDLAPRYSIEWPSVSATWVTELTPEIGLYWGFQTGEHGEKYAVQPAINLGAILVDPLSERSTLSLTATGVVGGWLKEGTCQANYGAIGGGWQTVNCRLSAGTISVADTLNYLVNIPPPDWLVVGIRYTFRF